MLIARLINEFYMVFVSDIVECSRNSIRYISSFISSYCRLMPTHKHTQNTDVETHKNDKFRIHTLLRISCNKCIMTVLSPRQLNTKYVL